MGLLDRIRKTGPPPVEAEPLSVSGRGHVDGFLQLEELNVDLQGRQGLEIFDRMFFTDADVAQVVNLVIGPITAGTWEVIAAGGSEATQDDTDNAAFVRWALFENMTPNLRGHLMEALPVLFRSGFAPFEKVWEVTEYEGAKVTVPRSVLLRLPRTIYRWKQDVWGGLEAIEQYLPVPKAQVVAGPNVMVPGNPVLQGPDDNTTGRDDSSIGDSTIITDTRMPDYRQTVWIPMSNMIYYRVGAEGDNWEGRSLLRPAYKHWLMKDAIERMDAIAQEKEALGIPICYPPLGATPDQLDAVEMILNNIRSNSQGYILSPGPKATGTSTGSSFGQGWLFEWLSMGKDGTGRDPQPSLKYHTDKIAAAFIAEFVRLGHSLTGGNRGLGETQRDPFLVGVEATAGLIEDILNEQLVAPIMAYNRPKARTYPRVKMSLIDASTLSELADFILKLVQVGAMLPDQTLEDFLRARADLPPSDPDSVSERGELDDALRREIIVGKNQGGGAPAGTNGPAGSETGGSATKAKGTDNKAKSNNGPPPPTSAHDALTRKVVSQTLADAYGGSADDYSPLLPGQRRVRWRPQAYYELASDLDGIEDHFDGAPLKTAEAGGQTMCNLARSMAVEYPKRTTAHSGLADSIHKVLDDSYGYGQQTVSEEIEKKSIGSTGYQLTAPQSQQRATIRERANHAASFVLDQMHHAIAQSHMQGDDISVKQRQAERAGNAALKRVGAVSVPHAFSQGRHDRILDAVNAGDGNQWGVVYTAILDNNTCDVCRDADDGMVRALDDPVRLARKPPNPSCESNLSGTGNQCRCFEIPEPMSQE